MTLATDVLQKSCNRSIDSTGTPAHAFLFSYPTPNATSGCDFLKLMLDSIMSIYSW